MEYYFSHLDPVTFQRLINAILIARFGENVRLTPLRGADGGRDGETAPSNPYYRFEVTTSPPKSEALPPGDRGRYLFQVKHHRTTDIRLADARKAVISDFRLELEKNVLTRAGDERVNYFFLVTNVPSSRDAIARVDHVRHDLLRSETSIHADIWWSERLIAFLDQMPNLWPSFPDLFAGKKVPLLPDVISGKKEGIPRVIRIAIDRQYKRDSLVKFRQIELENSLSRLFIDLDLSLEHLPHDEGMQILTGQRRRLPHVDNPTNYYWHGPRLAAAVGLLLSEDSSATRRIILEGGPGQGKSTITQLVAQIYRDIVLNNNKLEPEGRWELPTKVRLPFRVELRDFAEWLSKNPEGSVEEHLIDVIKRDTGGNTLSVDQIHTLVENSPVLLIFDGLDEVGSEDSRDDVLKRIVECVDRFEDSLNTDLKVVLTTRPPAIAGRREQLPDFRRFSIAPLGPVRIVDFVKRWVAFQLQDAAERQWVRESFEKRQNEIHVKALATNPMQLSVLLHFIRLKGEAFPDRRVELYREYFKTVIDRDVEKSVELRKNRDTIDVLHQLIGYKIHSLTEAKKADGTLSRQQVLEFVRDWIVGQGNDPSRAHELFKIGEERLGLIVALKGEGENTIYGFEIQPIREYFAAAFISDQIQGNAHAVFQSLLRRTYWREVGLFLAGLRRSNEKADLVARCKTVDNDASYGWRQDGRAMTLQLLQEGVFSQPPHVYSEALDFVIDLLDPNHVPVQNQPKGLIRILPSLITQGERTKHVTRISNLVETFSGSSDERTIFQLYAVLSDSLTESDFGDRVLTYGGNSKMKANVRLRWPSLWGLDLAILSTIPNYWDAVPDEVWADSLWTAFLEGNHKSFAITPSEFHPLLVEEFAANPTLIATGRRSSDMTTGAKDLAIWKLLQAQRTVLEIPSVQTNQQIGAASLNEDGLNLAGLDKDTGNLIVRLVEVTRRLLLAVNASEVAQREALSNYLRTLKDHISEAGLHGWVACRCVTSLFQIYLASDYNWRMRGQVHSDRHFGHALSDNPEWYSLLTAASELFGSSRGDIASPLTGTYSYGFFDGLGVPLLNSSLIPTHVRLERGRAPASVIDLFTSHICDGEPLPYSWLERIPLTPAMIRPLVSSCSRCLPKLLVFLSERRFLRIGKGKPLVVQQIQRIVKVIRESDDERVLSGAWVALADSTFLQLAGVELTLKLLSAARTRDDSGSMLFEQDRVDPHVARAKDIAVINAIAHGVLERPHDFTFETVSKAATYVAEHSTVSMPSLNSEEQTLGIFFQKPAN